MDERGLTAYRLSQLTGMSERHLSALAAGAVHRPRRRTVLELAQALDVTVDELLGSPTSRVEVTISIPEDLADLLYALAAVRRSTVEEMAQHALDQYLATAAAQPETQNLLEAIDSARSAQGDDA